MISTEGNALVLNAVITSTLDTVNYFVFKNNNGEFFRKAPADIEIINSKTKVYTCWLDENEGNDTINCISLICNGTSISSSGTEIATQVMNIVKNNTQSLLLEWTVEIR